MNFESADVAAGAPGFLAPLSVAFSPNGSLLTYLYPDETGSRKVFGINLDDIKTPHLLINNSDASKTLSLQEQLRRERMRLFTQGISSYEWSKNGTKTSENQRMMIPLNGCVFLYNSTEGDQYKQVYDSELLGEAVDPRISPDGKAVAFVVKDDLYVLSLEKEGAVPVRLTINGAKDGITCGLADFIAQEEMHRFRGFWWSDDSAHIAYCEADETMVPEYKILHQGKEDPKHSETHRYPFAGETNPQVRLAVVPVTSVLSTTSETNEVPASVWMTLASPEEDDFMDGGHFEYYVARVGWWPDGSVMAQVENRAQSVLQLLRLDPTTGAKQVLVEERTSVWINLHEMLTPLSRRWTVPGCSPADGDFHFVWASERTGFSQLYLYRFDSATGTGINVTGEQPIGGGGEWVVESVDAVDEVSNTVYFSGNRGNAGERHLFCASLLPGSVGAIHQITEEPGYHTATVNAERGVVADLFSSILSPVSMKLYSLTKDMTLSLVCEVTSNVTPGSRLLQNGLMGAMIPPVLTTIRSSDGAVDLHLAVYLPPHTTLDSQLALPAIASVYGGPHVQYVRNSWALTADLRAQRMAQQGIVVIKCDNRGSARRGLAFEGAMHRDMGNVEVLDQVAAVEHFVQRGLVDPARVGMFGWSYGGYMSAMSLCRAPTTFTCAVAGAPVTSWDGYDTHYTERYMGTPQNNSKGYTDSSVMTHVGGMTGKLLLVHGLIDENVHFRHTARLINKLIEHRKRYELVLFPCERHSPHKIQDRIYMEDIMHEFFCRNLAPKKVEG